MRILELRYIVISLFLIIGSSCSTSHNIRNKDSDINDVGTKKTTQPQSSNHRLVDIEKAIFTSPGLISKKESDTQIMDALIKYLKRTPKGARVYISTYLFYYKPLVEALKKACRRKVRIKLLMEDYSRAGKIDNLSTYRQLKSVFRNYKHSDILFIHSDAAPHYRLDAKNQQNYALFSKVDLPQGLVKHLVFTTSQNFIPNGTKKANDAVIMTNNGLYDSFLDNWKEMKSRAFSGMKNFTYKVTDVGDSITTFFFPRRKNGKWDGKNTIVEQLEKLNKSGYGKDTVHVLMASFSGVNGEQIAKKLTALKQKGVTVEVIAGKLSKAVESELKELEGKGGYLKVINKGKQGLHSKTMLIKGVWDGKPQRIILTGSGDYSTHALKYNNEFLLLLKNSALFSDYWKNWDGVNQSFFNE
jgi:HKD family nuclease